MKIMKLHNSENLWLGNTSVLTFFSLFKRVRWNEKKKAQPGSRDSGSIQTSPIEIEHKILTPLAAARVRTLFVTINYNL